MTLGRVRRYQMRLAFVWFLGSCIGGRGQPNVGPLIQAEGEKFRECTVQITSVLPAFRSKQFWRGCKKHRGSRFLQHAFSVPRPFSAENR